MKIKRNRFQTHPILYLLYGGMALFMSLSMMLVMFVSNSEQFHLPFYLRILNIGLPSTIALFVGLQQYVKWANKLEYLNRHTFVRIAIGLVVSILLGIIFWVIGNSFFYNVQLENLLKYIRYITFSPSMILGLIISVFMFIMIEFLNFFTQSKDREIEIERLKSELLDFQYKQLKGQINPHFLFNSLNVLTSLIHNNQAKAVEFTKKLSHIYRYVLSFEGENLIEIEKEILFLHNYIDILTIRFGKGLIVEMKVGNNHNKRFIPPMSLQLLIENAVNHNIVDVDRPLKIEIYIESDFICVVNNVNPKISNEMGSGIGLSNLKRKYELLDDRTVEVYHTDQLFTVKLPML